MEYLIKNRNWEMNKNYNIDKLLYLLIDRPSKIDLYHDFIWLNNKYKWHRSYDLPAYVWNATDVYNRADLWWYKNGKKSYYINGNFLKK